MPRGPYWTKEEVIEAAKYVEMFCIKEIARKLDRSVEGVEKKLLRLGLHSVKKHGGRKRRVT